MKCNYLSLAILGATTVFAAPVPAPAPLPQAGGKSPYGHPPSLTSGSHGGNHPHSSWGGGGVSVGGPQPAGGVSVTAPGQDNSGSSSPGKVRRTISGVSQTDEVVVAGPLEDTTGSDGRTDINLHTNSNSNSNIKARDATSDAATTTSERCPPGQSRCDLFGDIPRCCRTTSPDMVDFHWPPALHPSDSDSNANDIKARDLTFQPPTMATGKCPPGKFLCAHDPIKCCKVELPNPPPPTHPYHGPDFFIPLPSHNLNAIEAGNDYANAEAAGKPSTTNDIDIAIAARAIDNPLTETTEEIKDDLEDLEETVTETREDIEDRFGDD